MKFLAGFLTLLLGLIISVVAGYFSVIGLGALFAAAFIPVVIMGSVLEAGKIMAASWLKVNWRNKNVSFLHKTYLLLAVFVLMLITALGIYGYLAKGHLEQEAPLASVELQIAQIERRSEQVKTERAALEGRLKQLDESIDVYFRNDKATQGLKARKEQEAERSQIASDMAAKDQEINTLGESLVPLRTQVSDVGTKLGPVKYVAQLFGWEDTTSAVNLVIIMIMLAFDPLAVMLILSGTISFGEWAEERRKRKQEKKSAEAKVEPEPRKEAPSVTTTEDIRDFRGSGRGADVTEMPSGTNLDETQVAREIAELTLSHTLELGERELALELADERIAELEQNAVQLEKNAKDLAQVVEYMMTERADLLRDLEAASTPAQAPQAKVTYTLQPEPYQDATLTSNAEFAYSAYPVVITEDPVSDPKEDKEILMELLEKNPAFLQEVIDVVAGQTQSADAVEAEPTATTEIEPKVTIPASKDAVEPFTKNKWLPGN